MFVKALTKTLYSISDKLVRRSYQDKMMAYHLGLDPRKLAAEVKT